MSGAIPKKEVTGAAARNLNRRPRHVGVIGRVINYSLPVREHDATTLPDGVIARCSGMHQDLAGCCIKYGDSALSGAVQTTRIVAVEKVQL